MDDFIITVEDFNTSLSDIDRSSRQKINEDTAELSNTINQLEIFDIYKLLHFPIIDNILGHKTHLNKFKRREITQYLLLDHNKIKSEIYNRKNTGVSQNM